MTDQPTQETGHEWRIKTLHEAGDRAVLVGHRLLEAGYPMEGAHSVLYASIMEALGYLGEELTEDRFSEVGLGFLESYSQFLDEVQTLLENEK